MKKIKMHSPNLTQENIARIRELFPGCVTEAKDKDGQLRLAVDFDQLRQELSESIVEDPQERYHLNWPGKRKALLTANTPITKTLRPCRKESVDFDTTKNLFIEGDNLDALKLLQENYLGKVKMIYIDPPYNTGNDFIYRDNYADTTEQFLHKSNQIDAHGNQLVANTETNGRFHSDWLSMIYARLKLSRHLLSKDGCIFVSIDEREAANMRKLLDEIYGASNLIGEFMVIKAEGGGLAKYMLKGHDYLLGAARDINSFKPLMRPKKIRGKIVRKNGEDYWIEEDWLRKQFGKYGTCPYDEVERYHGQNKKNEIDDGIKRGIYTLVRKNGVVIVGRYRKISEDGSKFYSVLKHLNKNGVVDLKSISLEKYFEFPKPISLLLEIILGCSFFQSDKDSIFLDYFSGSSTTAHAVMQLNAQDGGNRKFIMVQLPEPCDENSEAYQAGYKTISDIGKERIRRAGRKIIEGDCHEGWNKDIGFRVLKVDSSNMADVYHAPDAIEQRELEVFAENIKLDRTPEDLLFHVMREFGLELSLPIRREKIQNKTVFFVDENALVACFDKGVGEDLAKELAQFKPLKAVFLDNGFASDAVKINVDQLFKQISPNTEVQSI